MIPGVLASWRAHIGTRSDGQVTLFRLVAFAVAVGVIPPVASPEPYILRVLCLIGVYSLLATGLNIVVGRAGLLDLGYVAFFGLGSYSYALLSSPHFDIHQPFIVALVVAIGVTALSGIFLGAPVLPLRGDYLAIVTLGFGEIVFLSLRNLDRPVNITNGVNGILNLDPVRIGPWQVESLTEFYYLVLALILVGLVVAYRVSISRLGRAWVAIREDETAARASGINTTTTKLWAFALGASYSGAAGTLSAALQGSVFPDSFLFSQSVLILSMVVIGGMGTLWGPVAGAAMMVAVPEILRDFTGIRFVIVGVIFVVMMISRPHGLLGTDTSRRPATRSGAREPVQPPNKASEA
jgi:branched-chain amino acid transport system permease protein